MKRKYSQVMAMAAGLSLWSSIDYAQIPCSDTPAVVNLSASPLDKSLVTLTSQTSCNIGYDVKLVKRFQSPTVRGNLTLTETLIRLIKGTGLEVHTDSKGFRINQADQEAIERKAATLHTSLGQAVKSQTISQNKANGLLAKLSGVRTSVVDLAKSQGFVSAAEKASYQRTFTEVEKTLANR